MLQAACKNAENHGNFGKKVCDNTTPFFNNQIFLVENAKKGSNLRQCLKVRVPCMLV